MKSGRYAISSVLPPAKCFQFLVLIALLDISTPEIVMPTMTIRDLPVEVHQAIKAHARAHGRSAEAEVRAILQDAARPAGTIRLGSALAAIGDKYGGIELELTSRDETMRTAELP